MVTAIAKREPDRRDHPDRQEPAYARVGAGEVVSGAQRLPIVSFGHAGNGNLHVNVMVDPDDGDALARAHLALESIMLRVIALGGTLSGEHGIGTEKRKFVPLEIAPATLELMRAIKRQFDPHGLLNPGKLFPD